MSEDAVGEHSGGQEPHRTRGWWRPLVLLAVVVAVSLAAWVFDVSRTLKGLLQNLIQAA